MRLGLAIGTTLTIVAGTALAQAVNSTAPAASESTKAATLKLVSVNGDTFDLLKLRQPLVLLVAGTDSASGAAAEVVRKVMAEGKEPAMYFAVVEAGLGKATRAAEKWRPGYVILSDSGRKMRQWLLTHASAKMLSPKANVPFAVFVDTAGKVSKAETSVTAARVKAGVMALAEKEETMTVIDPVCGMTIDRKSAAATYEYQGKTYYFCSTACKDRFAKDPQKYLSK